MKKNKKNKKKEKGRGMCRGQIDGPNGRDVCPSRLSTTNWPSPQPF
jgi:hypothetical protein